MAWLLRCPHACSALSAQWCFKLHSHVNIFSLWLFSPQRESPPFGILAFIPLPNSFAPGGTILNSLNFQFSDTSSNQSIKERTLLRIHSLHREERNCKEKKSFHFHKHLSKTLSHKRNWKFIYTSEKNHMFNVDHCRHFVKGSRKKSLKRTKKWRNRKYVENSVSGEKDPHEFRYNLVAWASWAVASETQAWI